MREPRLHLRPLPPQGTREQIELLAVQIAGSMRRIRAANELATDQRLRTLILEDARRTRALLDTLERLARSL